MHDAGMLA
jgi:hypothetical protein